MAKTDKTKHLKSSLKNTKAQLKRREAKIANLEARIEKLEAEVKKKAQDQIIDQALQNITKEYQDINSPNLSSDLPSYSEAKQTAALEILLKLLKN